MFFENNKISVEIAKVNNRAYHVCKMNITDSLSYICNFFGGEKFLVYVEGALSSLQFLP